MMEEKAAETLEREFASAVTRVYTVTATALIAGIILTALISQQIREHEGRMRVLAHESRKFRNQEESRSKQLRNSDVLTLLGENTKLRRFTPSLPWRVAGNAEGRKERLDELEKLLVRADKIVDDARAAAEKAATEKEAAENVVPERGAAQKAAKAKDRKTARAESMRLAAAGREPSPPRANPKVIAANIALRDAVRKLDSLQSYRAQLAKYRTTYAEASSLATSIEAHAEEVRHLRESKQALPTPFGQFDVSPRFGLIGVLLGVIGAYLYIISVATKARRIAGLYHAQYGEALITRGLPAPDWLATFRGTDLSKTLGWDGDHGSRRLRSVAIHIVWVALIAYLSIEIWRWKAWKDVLVAPSEFVVVSIGLAVLAGIAATAVFLTDTADTLYSKLPFNGSRRRFIAVTGIATGAALALLLTQLRHWPKRKRNPLARTTVAELGGFVPWKLVVNEKRRGPFLRKKPRVVHHRDVCSGHLPREAEMVPVRGDDVLHTHCRVAILTALMKEQEREGEDTQSLAMLALRIAPESIHLYDALIRNDARGKGNHALTRATMENAIIRARHTLAVATAMHEKSPTNKSKKHVQQSAAFLSRVKQQHEKMLPNTLPKKPKDVWIVATASSRGTA